MCRCKYPSFWVQNRSQPLWGKSFNFLYVHLFITDDSKGKCVGAGSAIPASGYWTDLNCEERFPYVCEVLREGYTTQSPNPPSKTNPSNIGCAAGWIGYGSQCFRVRHTDKQTLWITSEILWYAYPSRLPNLPAKTNPSNGEMCCWIDWVWKPVFQGKTDKQTNIPIHLWDIMRWIHYTVT